MRAMEQSMSQELPAEARSIIEKWTGKSYKLGLGQEWEDKKWKATDKNALDFFRKHDQHFFGKQFNHYSEDMRNIVIDELKGVRGDKSGAARGLKKKLGDTFESPAVKDHYDLCIRNAVNKSRNYGAVFQYERLGIAEVEILAILDSRTSIICREMNGRRISVQFLADHVREVLETPMDELTEKFAWPRQSDFKDYGGLSTEEILSKISVPLPPYHGRCRTRVIVSKDIKIRKTSGGFFSGNIRYNKKNTQAVKRARDLANLTKNELLSKMDSRVKSSWWDEEPREWPDGSTRKSYDYHYSKHGRDFRDSDGYKESLKKFLKLCPIVYTFDKNGQIHWVIFDNKTKHYLDIFDDGKINTFHVYSRFRPKDYMVEIE